MRFLFFLFVVAQVFASEIKLSPVVVYGDYQQMQDQDLPASYSIIPSDILSQGGADHFEDLAAQISGFNYSGGTSRPKYFQIRGVGERSLYQGVPNHSVGVLLDEIDVSGMGNLNHFYDLEQIEVAQGPRATRFGVNALAGYINYKSIDPSANFSGKASIDLGSENLKSIRVGVGGPLSGSKKFLFRLASFYEQSDGMIKNSYLNRDDTNGIEEYGVRFKLRMLPNSNLQMDLMTFYSGQFNGYDAWTLDNSQTTISDHPGMDHEQLAGGSFKINYKMDEVTLKSITALSFSNSDYNYDEDWGNNEYWNGVDGYNADYNYYAENGKESSNLSQELRLMKGDWVIGGYANKLTEESTSKSFKDEVERVSKRVEGDFSSESYSLFAQKDFALGDRFVFQIGGRFEAKSSDYSNNSGVDSHLKDKLFGGSLSFIFQMNQDGNLYATFSRGYKSGGTNVDGTLPDERMTYKPESLYNFELGFKGELSSRLRLKSALFYSLRYDQQIQTTYQSDPMDPNSFVYYKDNAAKTDHLGLENSFRWKISDSTMVDGSLSFLRAKFLDYQVESENKKGRDVAQAPSYQFALRMSHFFYDKFFISAGVTGKDSFYFSDNHNQKSDAYQLVNLGIGYKGKRYKVTLWGKNIFDTRYQIRGFYFANEPPAWEDKLYTQQGASRSIGLNFQAEI